MIIRKLLAHQINNLENIPQKYKLERNMFDKNIQSKGQLKLNLKHVYSLGISEGKKLRLVSVLQSINRVQVFSFIAQKPRLEEVDLQ